MSQAVATFEWSGGVLVLVSDFNLRKKVVSLGWNHYSVTPRVVVLGENLNKDLPVGELLAFSYNQFATIRK